jgi:hypothetical protein
MILAYFTYTHLYVLQTFNVCVHTFARHATHLQFNISVTTLCITAMTREQVELFITKTPTHYQDLNLEPLVS